MKHSCLINGYDSLNLTKLDILDDLAEIKVGVKYIVNGKELLGFPGPYIAFFRNLFLTSITIICSRLKRFGCSRRVLRKPAWLEIAYYVDYVFRCTSRQLSEVYRVHRRFPWRTY